MKTPQTWKGIHSALLLGILASSVTQPTVAQSVHRAKAQIMVKPSVQVSKVFADIPHYENLAVGDLAHPGRLIPCSMVYPHEVGKLVFEHCYVSFDSGQSWDATLKVIEGQIQGDPTAAYGNGDNLYAVALMTKIPDKPKESGLGAPQEELKTVVYKSTDGGRTWNESSRFQFIDRPFISVDNGKHGGRVYVVGVGDIQDISGSKSSEGLQIFRSLDDGRAFLGPVVAQYPQGMDGGGGGTGAVLSDGTFVVLFGLIKKGRKQGLEQDPLAAGGPNAELHVISSKDGGETFSKSQKIMDWTVDRRRSEGGMLGQLAVDPGSKLFKDRLYVVFPVIVSGRIQIQSLYSSDKGTTWSKPITVNDDRSPEQGGKGPDHLLPSIGVNKDGVVLVTWYDRREAKDNLGWTLRAAASLDGGETFSASMPVTDAANAYLQTTPWILIPRARSDDKTSLISLGAYIDSFFVSGGHTSGLAVDGDGTFHPTWVDNRTGIAQLWSAYVKVNETVVKHGATDLAELEDISKFVTLELLRPVFDPVKGALSMTARLKNLSKETVEGPVKIRALTLESEIGLPESPTRIMERMARGQSGISACNS